jgi:hypothetical protein
VPISVGGHGAVEVQGLSSLVRAFQQADKNLVDDLRDALSEGAQPVKMDAQGLAQHNISHMKLGSPWVRMRIGVMARSSIVYVAPVERGVKSRGGARKKRREFFDVLMDKSLQPALEHNIGRIVERTDRMLGEVATVWGRGA